jgi:hypothetical protein
MIPTGRACAAHKRYREMAAVLNEQPPPRLIGTSFTTSTGRPRLRTIHRVTKAIAKNELTELFMDTVLFMDMSIYWHDYSWACLNVF